MNKNFFQTIIAMLLVFTLAILLMIFLKGMPSQGKQQSTLASNLSLPSHMLAINMELKPTSSFSEEDIIDGNAPLLAIMNYNANDQPFFIQDFKELARFDANLDGRIEPIDPLYKNIALAYLQPNGSFKFVHLSQTGVHAIYLYKNNLYAVSNKVPVNYLPTSGSVVLADSSNRPLVVVNIQAPLAAKIAGSAHSTILP